VIKFDSCSVCGKFVSSDETVTISMAEYTELKSRENVIRPDFSSYRRQSGTKIARRPEQAEFIMRLIQTMTVTEVHQQCVEKFAAAAPSRSQIYRFANDMGYRRGNHT
jgi:hypothetical protein